jgi:hypothetical protein
MEMQMQTSARRLSMRRKSITPVVVEKYHLHRRAFPTKSRSSLRLYLPHTAKCLATQVAWPRSCRRAVFDATQLDRRMSFHATGFAVLPQGLWIY